MKSKAAIGNHPVHPMLVPIPIGAFFVALVGDALHLASPRDPFWKDLSATCIGIGLLFAVAAALFGAIDYLGLRMRARTFRLASWHALINVGASALYAISFFLRRGTAAAGSSRWAVAATASTIGFALLSAGGWIGGKLAYEHGVGVVESVPDGSEQPDAQRAAS